MRSFVIEKAWTHRGLDCVALALSVGHRCGYVRVPEDHIWFGKRCCHPLLEDVEVHGGLLDSGGYLPKGYWIGFDCAHYGDAPDPEILKRFGKTGRGDARPVEGVRSLGYVVAECERLADQVVDAPAIETLDDVLRAVGVGRDSSPSRDELVAALRSEGWDIVRREVVA